MWCSERFHNSPTDLEAEEMERCFGGSIGIGAPIKGVTVGAKLGGEKCGKSGSFSKGETLKVYWQ